MLPEESFLGLKENPVAMGIVHLCTRTTGKTMDCLTIFFVKNRRCIADIFVRVAVAALIKRVRLINYYTFYCDSFLIAPFKLAISKSKIVLDTSKRLLDRECTEISKIKN